MDASFNQIVDLIELEMCSSIIKLNLKSNLIADEDNLTFLVGLDKLKSLNISNNPIVKKKISWDKLFKDVKIEL
jgi:hypothetical protein